MIFILFEFKYILDLHLLLQIFQLYIGLPFESVEDVEQHISQEIKGKHYLDDRCVFYHKMDLLLISFIIFELYIFLIPSIWKLIDQRQQELLCLTRKNKFFAKLKALISRNIFFSLIL